MSIQRGALLLVRVGGVLVASGIASAFLSWALAYFQVSLASIAIPVGVALLIGSVLFVLGAVIASAKR